MWNFYRYSFRLCKTQLMELFKASTIMTKLPQVFRILPWDNILGNRRSNPKKTIKLLLNKQKHQKLIIKGKFTNRRRKPLSNRRPFKSWLNFSEEALMHIALLCHKRLMHTFYSHFPSAAFTFKKGAILGKSRPWTASIFSKLLSSRGGLSDEQENCILSSVAH